MGCYWERQHQRHHFEIHDFSRFSFLIDDTINLRRIKYEQIDFDEEKEKLI